MTITTLTSLQNKRVKRLVRLNSRRARDAERLTLVEGVRECQRAIEARHLPVEAYVCPELVAQDADATAVFGKLRPLAADGHVQLFEVTTAVFEKIAYRGQTGGLLLLVPYWDVDLAAVLATERPFLAVVEDAQKPGNLGAILRTADGAGVTAVLNCSSPHHHSTDLFNPNVVRASLGTIFSQPVVSTTSEAAIAQLKADGVPIVIATPEAKPCYTEVNLQPPVAVVTGSEAFGLSQAWRDAADVTVRIPMAGAADSLNLSAATALMLYEVVRQQTTKTAVVAA